MTRMRIDFAGRRFLPSWGMRILMVSLLTLLAGGAHRYATLHAAREQLLRDSAQVSEQRSALDTQLPPAPTFIAPERRAAVSAAISELNIRWPALLDALERSKPAAAVLLRIEPRTKDRALLITAQAPDAGTLVDFMDALAAARPFVRVTPLVQEPHSGAEGPALQGSFLAHWLEPGQEGQALVP